MCQHMADVDSAESVVDFCNQPVPIAINVEDRPLPNGVRARKSLPYVCQIFPLSLLCNPKPRVQRSFKVAAPRDGFLELLAADYVHAAPRGFAFCEDYTSHSANGQLQS